MKSTMLTLALISILITSSLQDDDSDCSVSSSTEIAQKTCFDKGVKFFDTNYKCCWMKLTKNKQDSYQCERKFDNLSTLLEFRDSLELNNEKVELLCNSIHDDDVMCLRMLKPVVIAESVCTEKTKQLKKKDYSCCYLKGLDDETSTSRYGCYDMKNTKEEIDKLIDLGKKEGITLEVICTSSGFMPSVMGMGTIMTGLLLLGVF